MFENLTPAEAELLTTLQRKQELGKLSSSYLAPTPTPAPIPVQETPKPTAEAVKEGYTWKGERLTEEARDFILFMVNTFLRPSDWYGLKRKHVTVQARKGEEPLLVISPPSSKTINTPIVSMPAAVGVYKNILKQQDERRKTEIGASQQENLKPWDEEAFVIFPPRRGSPAS